MNIKQIALITGVGKPTGIGFETARQLASIGYQVIMTARKQETADQLAVKNIVSSILGEE